MSSREALYAAWMEAALMQAQKARWQTFPNPCVGAVLVKDERICAQGFHRKAGLAHAEVACIKEAREKGIETKGATLVVTLEPCNHYGKTPPCTDLILAAGISRVIYGLKDCNETATGGCERLAQEGVQIIGPVLEEQCLDLVADFRAWQIEKRPFVLLKMAATLDGRIATRTGQSQWISSKKALEKVHRLRARIGATNGCILVGGKTFRCDNPSLTARIPALADRTLPQPTACVLTSHLPSVRDSFHLIQERPKETVFLSSAAAAASIQAQELRKLGCRVYAIPQHADGTTDLKGVFQLLFKELHAPYVLCEGGSRLAMSLLEEKMVDEFHLHLAPIIMADDSALPLFTGRHPLTLEEAIHMRTCAVELLGADTSIILRPRLQKHDA